jgi:phage head maturation protease
MSKKLKGKAKQRARAKARALNFDGKDNGKGTDVGGVLLRRFQSLWDVSPTQAPPVMLPRMSALAGQPVLLKDE